MRNINENCMVIFDIEKNDIILNIAINPNLKSRKYIFIDDQGFCTFNLCRSCDVYTTCKRDPRKPKSAK